MFLHVFFFFILALGIIFLIFFLCRIDETLNTFPFLIFHMRKFSALGCFFFFLIFESNKNEKLWVEYSENASFVRRSHANTAKFAI